MDDYKLAIYWDDQGKHEVTVKNVKDWLDDFPNTKNELANFIYQRFYTRYLKPFTFGNKKSCVKFNKEYKNGFSMMANYCLLIEALQSFKEGLEDSKGNSRRLFQDFFQQNKNLAEFQSMNFYQDVRCGILHQGETTGGIKITRKGDKLWDDKTKTINAISFGEKMEEALRNYRTKLENASCDDRIWECCNKKLQFIINNCAPHDLNNQNT